MSLGQEVQDLAGMRDELMQWRQVWDNVKAEIPNLREDNKPLAVAATYALLDAHAKEAIRLLRTIKDEALAHGDTAITGRTQRAVDDFLARISE